MKEPVIVVGGGLAGLSACVALAERGWPVTLLEARPRLGGRASSFTDAATGQLVDACQHVSMGCCTAFADFCRTLKLDPLLEEQSVLRFLTPDRRVSTWQSDPLPAPLHLARSFLHAHFLPWREKLGLATALRRLQRWPADLDAPLSSWLDEQHQSPLARRRFWSPVLVSALNEQLDRVGIKYARKVFVDSFLTNRRGGVLAIPRVPLGRLYGKELNDWLAQRRVQVRLDAAVRTVEFAQGRVTGVQLRSGESLFASAVILAVPHRRVPELLPPALAAHPAMTALHRLETSPITSVHLWLDRPITPWPHVVLLETLGQWLFNRGEVEPGVHYVQVVISAAGELRTWGHDQIRAKIEEELRLLFPLKPPAQVLRCRVVTEMDATFSPVPGVDQWRPTQRTAWPGLFLAGDYTQTGWPATMEGAVRSGRLAAGACFEATDLIKPDPAV
jgi:squalene-associated FAD-dependent desaturase